MTKCHDTPRYYIDPPLLLVHALYLCVLSINIKINNDEFFLTILNIFISFFKKRNKIGKVKLILFYL